MDGTDTTGTHTTGDPGDPGDPDDPDEPDDANAPDDDATANEVASPGDTFPDRHRAVLALERRNWPSPGAKERAIREQLGLAPVRYYQLLNALLDDPRALAHDPVTVNRLRRIRAARRAER